MHWIEGGERCLSARGSSSSPSSCFIAHTPGVTARKLMQPATHSPLEWPLTLQRLDNCYERNCESRVAQDNERESIVWVSEEGGRESAGLWPGDKIKLESFKFENVLPFIIMTRPLDALRHALTTPEAEGDQVEGGRWGKRIDVRCSEVKWNHLHVARGNEI